MVTDTPIGLFTVPFTAVALAVTRMLMRLSMAATVMLGGHDMVTLLVHYVISIQILNANPRIFSLKIRSNNQFNKDMPVNRTLGLKMHNINQALKIYFKNRINFGPVDENSILKAEEMLNITFPPSYRAFLTEYGASYGNGIEIYGLPEAIEPPEWVNAAEQTLKDRKLTNIPDSYLAISDDGGDFRYYLDSSIFNKQGESPIVKIGPGIEVRKVVAESFLEFISLPCLP